jgi:predicted ATPase/class 3 adenylate cyclase
MALTLPTGTVTFLFTDIEGSTRLLQELGDRYRRVQDDHAAIMRKAIHEESGTVIRTEGDSFFAVFGSAVHAARAVLAAQRGLAAHEWTHGGPLLVRMGLHSGEGVLGGDDYLGIDVNRAARVAAAAHGGQVLLSEATRALVEEALPGDAGLLDLGEHRLKDFDRPIRLFQLTAPEFRRDFPPLRTLEVPTNLPAERSAFIGRDRELAELVELIRGRRLVTLTGPGGTGKTRLALRAAAGLLVDSPGGVFFVDLAAISDPGLVPSTIAGTLRVREEARRPIEDALVDHLRPREVLLVLDNFEQIIEAAPIVGKLLDGAPRLKTLVTSRIPLRVSGEQEFPVPPLAVPHDGSPEPDQVSQYESVILFVERARAVDPGFALTTDNAKAVAEICERVDGLPLAIELAASRVRMLSPQGIVERLDKRLPFLRTTARDVPERQRTLTAAIAWSHDLLADSEKALFRRLAVFVGGWALKTAEDVVAPDEEVGIETLDALESLVEKSLVRRLEDGPDLRFGMLETIREFGLEQLTEAKELEPVRARHADAFLRVAKEAAEQLTGHESKAWLDRLEIEHDNLRTALRWAIEAGGTDTGVSLGVALWRFWQMRGHLGEGRRWMEALLEMPGARARTHIRAKALLAAGSMSYWQGDLVAAERQYEESFEISRELDDARGVADGLFNLAFARSAREDDSAEALMLEARRMYEELKDERQVAFATGGLAMAAFQKGDFELSKRLSGEARERFQALGDLHGVGLMSGVSGVRALLSGDFREAREGLSGSLDAWIGIGNNLGVAVSLEATAVLAGRQGRHDLALRLAGASERIKETARGQAPGALLRLEDPRDLARGSLSSEQMAAAWERGRAIPIEAAVALAREELAAEDEG